MAVAKYIEVISCCDGLIILNFKLPSGFNEATDVYQYSGVSENGLVNDGCYSISTKTGTIGFVMGLPDVDAVDFTVRTGCDDAKCICDTPCYTLYPCDAGLEVLVSTSITLEPFIGDFVGVVGYAGCYFVVENALGDCVNGLDIEVNEQVSCNCKLRCYSITGNPTSVTYLNEDLEVVTTSGSTRVCSFITPVVAGGLDGIVYNFGECVDGICPEVCFEFTNCLTGETLIVSNTTTVLEYFANNNVVTLQGQDGCWSIDISNEPCDCAINVTILQVFDDCPTCLPIIAYKFTNCNNQSVIKYSTNDYSDYVGKTVKLDCGECWFVDLINYAPPAVQVITIVTVFDSCLSCSRTYYKLTDCTNISNVIYTYTDLLTYVGKVIKIKGCDECFSVQATTISTNADTVVVTENFDDCEACGATAPCICTTVKNYDTLPHTYTYIDCNGIAQTITLTSNQESEKECIRNFVGDKLCNCITITISGEPVTAVLQPNLVNGKPAWTFVYNTLIFNIVYDIVIGWKITNSTAPNPIATLGSPSITCPVGEWDVDSNPAIDISVFLDNGTLVLQGVLVYNYTTNLYTGDIEVEGTVYEFRLRVFYFMSCIGVWYLEYFNTDLPEPVWTDVAAFPADCSCLNGVYTDVEPTAFYIEIKGFCEAQTVDCSVGYEPFIPSATDDIKEYGDCINGACPAPVYPKRAIRPGYFVPSCDPDKYEKFACNSAEILYKTVLERRYGISNCCPDTDLGQRWIIKKELADLQGARDPNYICTPVQSCCNNTPTCGCGCNSTLKSCNSH